MSPYDNDLVKVAANYTTLSPLSFLKRSAEVYPNHTSIIHGKKQFCWRETYERTRRLASALAKHGVTVGDTVAVMAANTPEMYECAFGPAMIGAVVNMLNNRLDPKAIAFCLNHGEAKVLITDTEFSHTINLALEHLNQDIFVIDINDSEYNSDGELLGDLDYEAFLTLGELEYLVDNKLFLNFFF